MGTKDNESALGQKRCFVIGPIGSPNSPERRHADLLLHAIVKSVLERPEYNYAVHRSDEDVAPGMIGSKVVLDVIQSDLCVADLTGLNPNVFYELGIRHSAEKPVIHIAAQGTPLPFDNAPHHTIFVDLGDWHSQERARADLSKAVAAVGAVGFKVSNPITQANASFKMRHSADPQERVIAELKSEFESLRARIDDAELRRNIAPQAQQSFVGATPVPILQSRFNYEIGMRVFHQKFGLGFVALIDNNKITVDFDKAGRKTVIADFLIQARPKSV